MPPDLACSRLVLKVELAHGTTTLEPAPSTAKHHLVVVAHLVL